MSANYENEPAGPLGRLWFEEGDPIRAFYGGAWHDGVIDWIDNDESKGPRYAVSFDDGTLRVIRPQVIPLEHRVS